MRLLSSRRKAQVVTLCAIMSTVAVFSAAILGVLAMLSDKNIESANALSHQNTVRAAKNVSWAGYTAGYGGDFGGIKGGNQKCEAAYSGSHWASAEEISELGDSYPWTTGYHVWTRNSISNNGDFYNVVWLDGSIPDKFFNTCLGYTSEDSGYYGVVLRSYANSGYLDFEQCDASVRIACVY